MNTLNTIQIHCTEFDLLGNFFWPAPCAFQRVPMYWDLLIYYVTIAAPYPGGIDPRLAVYARFWDGHYTTTQQDRLNLIFLAMSQKLVTVKPHASTCTLRLQRLLPHPVIDISMVSTIVLPISARSQNLKHLDTRQVQRETLQTSCLCWAWLDSVCYTGLAGFHTQQVYAENSANSCAMARVFTRVHVFTDELKIMFNLSFQFYLWLSIICILDGLASELEGKLL